MKTLILTRHAKSSWSDGSLSDFQRPLNKRGQRDVPTMAKRLLSHGTAPQLIISSTAVRAMQTTEQLMPLINAGSDRLLTTDSIYEAPLSALQDAASQLPDSISVAMMVGHNPGMSSLGNFLCSRADLQMPTCAMACFELDIDHWQGIYRDCATMRWYDYPKKG